MGRELDTHKARLAYILIISGVVYMFYATQVSTDRRPPPEVLWIIGICICGGLALVGTRITRLPGFGGDDNGANTKGGRQRGADSPRGGDPAGVPGARDHDPPGNLRLLGV